MASGEAPTLTGTQRTAAALQPYICGGASAMFASSVIHPMDLTKTRMQVLGQGSGFKGNLLTVMRDTVRTDGVRALYSGLSAAIGRQAVYGTARIGLYTEFSNMIRERNGGEIPVLGKIAASLSSGAIASFIGNPFDVALVRMQADSLRPVEERRGYTSAANAIARIIKEEGLLSLWRGAEPTIVRAMAMNLGMMASYDQIKETILGFNGPGLSTDLMAAAGAGFTCAVASLPFDLIKTRLQNMRPDASGKMPYSGVLHCARRIAAEEGVLAFWQGLSAYYLRSAPHAMIILMTREQLTKAYASAFDIDKRI